MFKHILSISILAMSLFSLSAQVFTAVNSDGKEIIYSKLDDDKCMVVKGKEWDFYKGIIVIPKSVTFDGKELTVTAIDDGAFMGSLIKEVTIPSSVTYIGKHAFRNNDYRLEYVNMESQTPPELSPEGCFSHRDEGLPHIWCTLRVPQGALDAYASAPGWENFNSIKECDESGKELIDDNYRLVGVWESMYHDCRYRFEDNGLCSKYHKGYNSTYYYFKDLPYSLNWGFLKVSIIDDKSSVNYSLQLANLKADSFTIDFDYVSYNKVYDEDPAPSTITQIKDADLKVNATAEGFLIEGLTTVNQVEFYSVSGTRLEVAAVKEGCATFKTREPFVIIKLGDRTLKASKRNK